MYIIQMCSPANLCNVNFMCSPAKELEGQREYILHSPTSTCFSQVPLGLKSLLTNSLLARKGQVIKHKIRLVAQAGLQ
jgi:hypothetical protein